jgi:hypothetical protein
MMNGLFAIVEQNGVECRGRVVGGPALYSGHHELKWRPVELATLAEFFVAFLSAVYEKVRRVELPELIQLFLPKSSQFT